MNYSVITLMDEIRTILDRNKNSEQLINVNDIDTLSIDNIIESKIVDAAKFIEYNAPSYLLGSGNSLGTSANGETSYNVTWKSAVGVGMGSIILPDDFMRLITFQMTDWSRPANVITEDSPEYAMQSSRYPGVRGCPQKPIVAIVPRSNGLLLEFYSCTAGDTVTVKHARYLAIPAIIDGTISLCDKLKNAIEYYAAYLACITVMDTNMAAPLRNTAFELSEIQTKTQQ